MPICTLSDITDDGTLDASAMRTSVTSSFWRSKKPFSFATTIGRLSAVAI